jgi:hypothetical protein
MRLRLGGALVALCLLSGVDSQTGQASSLVDLQRDGQVRIAGRALRCGAVRNVLDAALPNLGLAAPGVLVLNPHLLNRQSNTVRLFVFHHECGHHHVGSSEIGADCWAVKQGVRQGWIGQQGIEQICRSFGNRAATPTHPSSAERCASLRQCFAGATTSTTKRRNSALPGLKPVSKLGLPQ